MRILITDSVYPKNGGDSAILLQIIEDLGEKIPSADFTVLSRYSDSAEKELKWPVLQPLGGENIFGKNFPFNLIQLTRASIFILFGKFEGKGPEKRTLRAYKEADCVISCGGGFIRDGYDLLGKLFGFMVARSFGKPLVIYAQSIGPLDKIYTKLPVRWVLDKFDLIITRDAHSAETLKSIGVVGPRIEVTADAAINLKPGSKERAREILEENLSSSERPLVGISVREWIYPSVNRKNQLDHYTKTIARIADHVVDELGADVIFISTCNAPNYRYNDPKIAAGIKKEMANQKRATIIKEDYPVRDIKGLIGKMDLCICTRMHPLIFATTMGVPTVGISYEFKTMEYMRALGLEEYVVDIVDVDYDELKEKVDKAWERREEIGKKLKERVPILRKKAGLSAELVAELLAHGKSS